MKQVAYQGMGYSQGQDTPQRICRALVSKDPQRVVIQKQELIVQRR